MRVSTPMKSDKSPFFDIASVFAANIRLSADDVPYVSCNEQTRFVLDNIEQTVRPLQAKGIKFISLSWETTLLPVCVVFRKMPPAPLQRI